MLGCLAGTHKPVEFSLELSAALEESLCALSEGTCAFLRRERQNVNMEEDMQEECIAKHAI